MGKVNNGIFGSFSGKVGNVVGWNRKGQNYIKSAPGKRNKAATPAQLVQRARFGLLTHFFKGFGGLFTVSYKNFTGLMSGCNAALSNNKQDGITGEYPDFAINYPLIQISSGKLQNVTNPTCRPGEKATVDFSWGVGDTQTEVNGNDTALLVLYDPAKKQVAYTLQGGLRKDKTASIYASSLSGCTVQTWIAFLAPGAGQVSNSMYTGVVTIE